MHQAPIPHFCMPEPSNEAYDEQKVNASEPIVLAEK
jgi:hypothetical protein